MRLHALLRSVSFPAAALLGGLLTGCAHIIDEPGPDGVAPAALAWYLPKTERIDIVVTSEVVSCDPLRVAVRAEATPVFVTDWATRHSVTVEGLGGPFGTAELAVEAWPEGMVKTLGGKSEDRTGPTIVAIVETALKGATLAFGGLSVGSRRPTPTAACSTTALHCTELLNSAQESLNTAPLDDKMLLGRATQIERLKAALRVQQHLQVTFASTPPPDRSLTDKRNVDGKRLKEKGLVTADPFQDRVQVTLKRSYVTGEPPKVGPAIGADAFHYREPVRMLMTASVGCEVGDGCPIEKALSQPVAFGVAQWGTPRRLPLRVGLFGNVSEPRYLLRVSREVLQAPIRERRP